MKKFKVVLRNLQNPSKTKFVTISAKDSTEAMTLAEKEGWMAAGTTEIGDSLGLFGKLKSNKDSKFGAGEVVKFCKGMATMLTAGISIVDALDFYSSTLPNPKLKAVLEEVKTNLKSGDAPKEAFGKTKAFDSLFLGLVSAGAAAGDIGGALRGLAHQLELQQDLRRKLKKIIILPAAVIVLLGGIFLAAQLIVTPKIHEMLIANHVEPDAFSSMVFGMAAVTAKIWIPTLILLAVIVGAIIASRAAQEILLTAVMSKVRAVRNVVMGIRQTIFIGTLSMLQNSGLVMEEALSITAGAMGSNPMGKEIIEVRNQYLTGLDVSKCVKQFTSCDPTVVHMIAIGEQTGQLPEQLTLCASMLEGQTKDHMEGLASTVQLLSTAIPVVLIAFIFISSYLPIVMMSASMMKSFS